MARAARFTFFFVALSVFGCGGSGPESDAGSLDSGPARDTNSDAPACHADVDCDDGIFCDGTERCVMGACVAGTAPACSDAIACTRDFCSEDRHACTHQVPDMDHDGHGAMSCVDAHGTPLGDDCADDDANDFPGNTEVCDAMHHDEDCNVHTHGHVDADSDGFEDATCCNGTDCGTDCDDSNRSVNPSATEVCNLIDDDCDAHVDEGTGVMLFTDADRDGYGDSAMATSMHCGDAVGYSARGLDCNDTSVAVHPGQPELCDMIDNDCDMIVDENTAAVTWYVDHDGDGYGTTTQPTLSSCTPQTGYSLLGTDCDDDTTARSPRAPEVCNALDDDCNGRADYAIAPGDLEDDDADHSPDLHCGAPLGADCNDRDPLALPGAPEICNGRDDDCDGHIDEDATSATFHHDGDHDGYGDPGTTVIACFSPMEYVLDASDCDDTSPTRHPGALELCNASDDDCDGTIDEAPAAMSCGAYPHGVAACTVGICHLTSCAPGRSDCTLAPGCETSTVASSTDCGACHAGCFDMALQCAHSTCEPGGSFGIAGVSAGDDVGTAVAASGARIVIGGHFAGTGFGVGCGSAFDARGVAGVVSLRDGIGACQNATAIDGTGDESVTSVAIDASGNVWVALTTTSATLSIGTIAVNAGVGQGASDVVIAAFDATLTARWAMRFGGLSDDAVTDIAFDGTDVWFVGAMRGPVALGSMMLATSATNDTVVVRLAGATGSVVGFTSATTSGVDGALGMAFDQTGVYVVGSLVGSGRFGMGPSDPMLTAMGPSDGFLWSIARPTMATLFARAIGGSGTDITTSVETSAIAPGHPIVVTGGFEGTVMIDATRSITSAGLRDGFVMAVDGANVPQWITRFGGPSDDILNDIIPVFGDFDVVGTFGGTATASADAGITSAGGSDGVLMRAQSATGSLAFPIAIGGTGPDELLRITLVGGMQLWLAGDYTNGFRWSSANFIGVGGLDAFWLQSYPPGS